MTHDNESSSTGETLPANNNDDDAIIQLVACFVLFDIWTQYVCVTVRYNNETLITFTKRLSRFNAISLSMIT